MLGAKEAYTFGSYRGSLEKPDSKMILAPGAGIYWSSKFFSIEIIYEYMDYDLYGIDPGRINISFSFKSVIKRKKYYPKEISDFN